MRHLILALSLLSAACAAPLPSHQAALPAPASSPLSGSPLSGSPISGSPISGSAPGAIEVGIVAINDFHGNLEPPRQSVIAPDGKGGEVQVPAGGAAWLASAVDAIRAKYPNHLTVSAGDMIGASAISSALFLDEPAIGVMNRIGIDFNAVGNHEFDHGPAELKRIAGGGCAKLTERTPCAVERFAGASFPFLAANTLTADGRPLFPGSALRSFGSGAGRITIGIIGVTLKGTADLVSPAINAGLHWADEADTVNALVPGLKAAGADTIVLLIHQGGRTLTTAPHLADPNGCDGFYGEIGKVLDRLDPAVEVVVSGHTHWAYICNYGVPGRARPLLLTSAGLWGEMVTDIALTFDPSSHKLTAARAHNVIVQSPGYTGALKFVANTPLYPQFAPRPDIAAYVKRYVDAGAAMAQRRIGWLAASAEKTDGALNNTGGALGRLIADSQLAGTRGAGAQIAFMNPFGIRTSLFTGKDHSVSFGAAYAVEPFNNPLVTISLTGAQIKAALEQCFDTDGPEQVLTPSAGFVYTYDRARPIGSRIVAVTLDGQPLDPARTYRVSMSEFLSKGGDSFTAFSAGTDRVNGMIDVDALIAWLKPMPPRALPGDRREIDLAPDLKRADPNKVSPPGVKY